MSFNPDYFYTLGYRAQALFEYYNHSTEPMSADVSVVFGKPTYEAGLLNASNDSYARRVQADFPEGKVYVEFDNGDPISAPAVYLLACNTLDFMVEKFAGYLNIPVPTLPDLSGFAPAYVGMRPDLGTMIRIIAQSNDLNRVREWCLANSLDISGLVDTGPHSTYEISFDWINDRITNPTVMYTAGNTPITHDSWYQSVREHANAKIAENYAGITLLSMDPLIKVSLSNDLPADYVKVYFMAIPRLH